ncbi:MAG: hypothetical protein IKK47_06360 [Ruminococcus sp.]|nr:hypothetical protein [Ruminococcus sp.]
MGIKSKMKKNLMGMRGRYVDIRKRNAHLKTIKKHILEGKEPIPQLTSEQENEIKKYWGRFGIDVPLEWHRLLYAKTGMIRPDFVPEPIFHYNIKKYMNNHTFAEVWGDKCYIDYFIRDVQTVKSVIRNVNGRFLNEKFEIITLEEAQKIADNHDRLVIKPSTYTDTGKGVKLLKAPFDMKSLYKEYKKNFVVQIPLKQHEELSKLNASSINTIRVNSVLFDNEAHVMSAFIKVGQPGAFADNHGHDRYFIGITEEGKFNNYAINHDLQKFNSIPSGYDFAGKPVPDFDKVCRAIEKAHKCIPHFGFAFWDVCINENGEPVIVEANLRYPDATIPQVAYGPFLGKYTDQIMKYITKRK